MLASANCRIIQFSSDPDMDAAGIDRSFANLKLKGYHANLTC